MRFFDKNALYIHKSKRKNDLDLGLFWQTEQERPLYIQFPNPIWAFRPYHSVIGLSVYLPNKPELSSFGESIIQTELI
jgi:hypothetical protein